MLRSIMRSIGSKNYGSRYFVTSGLIMTGVISYNSVLPVIKNCADSLDTGDSSEYWKSYPTYKQRINNLIKNDEKLKLFLEKYKNDGGLNYFNRIIINQNGKFGTFKWEKFTDAQEYERILTLSRLYHRTNCYTSLPVDDNIRKMVNEFMDNNLVCIDKHFIDAKKDIAELYKLGIGCILILRKEYPKKPPMFDKICCWTSFFLGFTTGFKFCQRLQGSAMCYVSCSIGGVFTGLLFFIITACIVNEISSYVTYSYLTKYEVDEVEQIIHPDTKN